MREVYLQLPAGELADRGRVSWSPRATRSTRIARLATPVDVAGPWTVRFLKGGPSAAVRPGRRSARVVDDVRRGRGSVLRHGVLHRDISATGRGGPAWQLDLGRVAESARVRLNGRDLATLIGRAVSCSCSTRRS